MLIEWIKYLTTPCPRHLRRMGYLKELIGLEARYKRCWFAWAPHLVKARETILEAAADCSDRHRVVVLGSGLLYDVPLEDLSAMFGEVVLVDIQHMPSAWRRAKRFDNVTLVSRDITGVVEPVYDWVAEGGGKPLPRPSAGCLPLDGAGLVVSAAVLSQLHHLPVEYLSDAFPAHPKGEIDAFAKALVEHHLDSLAAFPGAVCLITEVERHILDRGKVAERIDPLHGAALPFPGHEWFWEIAPPPEMHQHYAQRLKMVGAVKREKTRDV